MKKILLVDDVSTNLKCVSKILKDRYHIITVKSGEEALRYIKKETPDLILLDICMPDMNGYEVMEKLRNNIASEKIPVIFLTGESDMESEIKGRGMGAVDFIRKPFMPEALLHSIQKALEVS